MSVMFDKEQNYSAIPSLPHNYKSLISVGPVYLRLHTLHPTHLIKLLQATNYEYSNSHTEAMNPKSQVKSGTIQSKKIEFQANVNVNSK